MAQQVTAIFEQHGHKTDVSVQPTWYY
jgi:hypothetical protein